MIPKHLHHYKIPPRVDGDLLLTFHFLHTPASPTSVFTWEWGGAEGMNADCPDFQVMVWWLPLLFVLCGISSSITLIMNVSIDIFWLATEPRFLLLRDDSEVTTFLLEANANHYSLTGKFPLKSSHKFLSPWGSRRMRLGVTGWGCISQGQFTETAEGWSQKNWVLGENSFEHSAKECIPSGHQPGHGVWPRYLLAEGPWVSHPTSTSLTEAMMRCLSICSLSP